MARQVTTPIRQVRQSFDGLLIPAVAKTIGVRGAGGAGEALATATRMILVIQLPILIALFAIGERLMSWLGHGFAVGYWPLVILAAAEVLQSALGIGDLVFVYLRPRIGLYLTLISIARRHRHRLAAHPALRNHRRRLRPVRGLCACARSCAASSCARQFAVAIPHAHVAGPFAAAGARGRRGAADPERRRRRPSPASRSMRSSCWLAEGERAKPVADRLRGGAAAIRDRRVTA